MNILQIWYVDLFLENDIAKRIKITVVFLGCTSFSMTLKVGLKKGGEGQISRGWAGDCW